MSTIGDLPLPSDFKYRELFRKGCPRHQKTDPFRIRHPSMEPGRRAKIFAPFDALAGFSDAIRSQEILSRNRQEPERPE